MAENHVAHHVDNDYVEHEKTYGLFTNLIKWGSIFCIALLMFIGSMTHLVPWALTLFVIIALLGASSFV